MNWPDGEYHQVADEQGRRLEPRDDPILHPEQGLLLPRAECVPMQWGEGGSSLGQSVPPAIFPPQQIATSGTYVALENQQAGHEDAPGLLVMGAVGTDALSEAATGYPQDIRTYHPMPHDLAAFEFEQHAEFQQLFPLMSAASSVRTTQACYPPQPELMLPGDEQINDMEYKPFAMSEPSRMLLPPYSLDGILPTGLENATMMTPPSMSLGARAVSIVSPRELRLSGNDIEPQPTIDRTRLPPMPTKFSPDRRKLCSVEGCKSQARAFNRCKRHGGSKRCSSPGCTKSVQSRGLCIRHGGGSRCQEADCIRAAQSHGKCKMHGGGRPCVVPGCEKKAHLKRLCRKHGGGAKCSLPGCEKWAQRQGMCMTHSKHLSPTAGPSQTSTPESRLSATPSSHPSPASSTPPPTPPAFPMAVQSEVFLP